MSDTPRTDAEAMDGAFKDQGCTITLQQWDYYKTTDGEVVMVEFARQLERELNAAKAALSGRTVSCSNCNAMAEENAAMREAIKTIYYDTEGDADGAPDASSHDKLCNEISTKLQPFLK